MVDGVKAPEPRHFVRDPVRPVDEQLSECEGLDDLEPSRLAVDDSCQALDLVRLDRDGDQTVQIPVIPTKADWHRVRMNVTTPVLIRNIKIGAVS